MNSKETKSYLIKENFVPSKKMGQNFLIDNNIKNKIVDVSDAKQGDTILEIGPGLGAITQIILERGFNLLCVELDKRLAEHLTNKFSSNNNFELVNDDILKYDISKKLDEKETHVIANLPYSISSKIIFNLIKIKNIKSIVIMVQKELALRVIAKVGSKDYGSLAVISSLFFESTLEFDVSPKNFIPEPAVNSSILKLKRKSIDFSIDYEDFYKFLKILFAKKRKTLVNNLISNYEKEIILKNLDKLEIDNNIRAEKLNPKTIHNLFLLFKES